MCNKQVVPADVCQLELQTSYTCKPLLLDQLLGRQFGRLDDRLATPNGVWKSVVKLGSRWLNVNTRPSFSLLGFALVCVRLGVCVLVCVCVGVCA